MDIAQKILNEIIEKIEQYSGRSVIVNKSYSGTQIIHDYGERQMDTGELIVYTSGDSVMQITAYEDVIPLEELYDICRYARTLVNGPEYIVGRVIARPFVGPDKDHFTRTANRHDFSLAPTGKTNDIFSGRGIIDQAYHNESNMDGMDHVDEVLEKDFTGFCFTNLVDFDTMYGHRRDPKGFGQALMDFDQRLGHVLAALRPDDLLLITADHGNDPCQGHGSHTRRSTVAGLVVKDADIRQPRCSLNVCRSWRHDLG